MTLNNLNSIQFTSAYGILCSKLNAAGERKGVYPTLCRIPVGGATAPHAHFEAETFFIISGRGSVELEGGSEVSELKAGDILQVPPQLRHKLIQSGEEDLVMLSVYSEDFTVPALLGEYLITAAPPTPNGPLHLGHMSGPYLASDVLARYLRARGQSVRTHCGTDDHQNYVPERARGLGQIPEVFRREMRARVMRGLEFMQIQFDEFIEPKCDEIYQNKVLRFFDEAVKKGVVRREIQSLPHCEHCALDLIDVLIEGECPHCHAGSRGGCESCGIVVPPQNLANSKCTRCGRAPGKREIAIHTFDLGEHLPAIASELRNLPLSPRLRNLTDGLIGRKNSKVVVSHPNCGGIQVPDSSLQLHVWFEMAAHYQSFAHSRAKWIHHFGFDNAFYYLAFIPALLRAMDPGARLPSAVVTNEFLQLDGQKFSTSRGHAIWADEVNANSDYLRLYLCHERPQTPEADFSLAECQNFARAIEKQFRRLFAILRETEGGAVSAACLVNCNRFTREMELFYSPDTMDLRRAARRILEFLDLAARESLANQRLMARVLATVIAPIMPATAAELGVNESGWIVDWTVTE